MSVVLDTSIAIGLRDGDSDILRSIATVDGPVLLSIVTRVELEGGVARDPAAAPVRRARLDAILEALPVLAFDDACADAYRAILGTAGHSRRKLLDRMIAAQALVHHASLVTRNPADFQDIPGLDLVVW